MLPVHCSHTVYRRKHILSLCWTSQHLLCFFPPRQKTPDQSYCQTVYPGDRSPVKAMNRNATFSQNNIWCGAASLCIIESIYSRVWLSIGIFTDNDMIVNTFAILIITEVQWEDEAPWHSSGWALQKKSSTYVGGSALRQRWWGSESIQVYNFFYRNDISKRSTGFGIISMLMKKFNRGDKGYCAALRIEMRKYGKM